MSLPRKIVPFTAAILQLLLPLIFLSGCGFTPLYGQNSALQQQSVNSKFQETAINIIPNREGQILRNLLIDAMHPYGSPQNPRYHLSISPIKESLRDLDITKTADTTRAQLKLNISMRLFDMSAPKPKNGQPPKPLLNRGLMTITSYNILASEFATQVAEQAARENALNDLSTQIQTQLALYFKTLEEQ